VRIEGEKHFAAPPADVYSALTDPEALESAFSVIERLEADGPRWTLVVRLPVPGGIRLKLSVRLEELREPEHARLRASGTNLGGRIGIDTSFDLAPDGEGTLMRWSVEIDAGGVFRGLGSQSLAPLAKQHAERALDRLVRPRVS
jgi:carbon monoxide dehydrogenase subunit G